MIAQGDVWWCDFGLANGSEAALIRPGVIVQGDDFNASALRTVVVVPLTSNLQRAAIPGCVELTPTQTGLPRTSVALPTLVTALNREHLLEREGRLPPAQLTAVLAGLDVVLGR